MIISTIPFLLFSARHITALVNTVTHTPILSLEPKGFEYQGTGPKGGENWQDIELINDEPVNAELYFHPKMTSAWIISTRGLNANHSDIKQTAIKFWKTTQEKS